MWPHYYWHHTGCQCAACRPCAAPTTTTTSLHQFKSLHEVETWAEAVRYALWLHRTGQSTGKPTVDRHDNLWRVRWVPRYYATYNLADAG